MYLPRVSVDLYFSSRLSFLSVMKSRDASPTAPFFIFSSNISISFATKSGPDGQGKDYDGDRDAQEDYRDGDQDAQEEYRDGDQDAQEEGEQPDADLVCRPLLALLPLHGQDGLVQVHLQETGGRRGS